VTILIKTHKTASGTGLFATHSRSYPGLFAQLDGFLVEAA